MSADQFIARVLLDIAVIIAVAGALAALLKRTGQPPVMAEILGGIILGPTVLGALPGNVTDHLFPQEVRQAIGAIGGVGLVVFLFLIGLELDIGAFRRHDRTVLSVSLGAILAPFVLGLGAALVLYPSHDRVDGHRIGAVPFALFLATALSITAFPVLVRILREHDMCDGLVGRLAVATAAIQDGVGWLLLAVALSVAAANGTHRLVPLALEASALAGSLTVARLLFRAGSRRGHGSASHRGMLTAVLVGLFACAGTSQAIGLHSALGAFLFGLAIPRDELSDLRTALHDSLMPVTVAILLPLYFLGPGLSVSLAGFDGHAGWQLVLVLGCACFGKLVGTIVPARANGLARADALRLGVLLNTRGLIELVVLNVGLSAGVLDPSLYSLLVVAAVVTTLMTGPALRLIDKRERRTSALRRFSAVASDAGGRSLRVDE